MSIEISVNLLGSDLIYIRSVSQYHSITVDIISNIIQVGWGSKDTQFHGTEGKGAAQKPVFATPTPISNDDHQVF